MKNRIIGLLLVLVNANVFATDYKYESLIDSIYANGFYKISLTPEIISRVKDNFADIRLFDSKNNELPYLIGMESEFKDNSSFKEHKVLSNLNDKKAEVNKIIVQNISGYSIDHLYLVYSNSEIEKEVTLKGSDDFLNWFIIAQAYPENIGVTENSTAQIKYLRFPKSSYKYFMIQTSIKNSDPLHLIRTGYYENGRTPGQYMQIPSPTIVQGDSAKYKMSFIKVNFPGSYKMSRVKIFVSGPEIYHRKFKLYSVRNSARELIGNDILSSRKSNVFDFHKFRTRELMLIIENQDDKPLKVDSITAYQLGVYMIAKLYRGEKYSLRFDNKEVQAPQYDLEYFKDKIPENLQKLKPSVPVKIYENIPQVKSKSIFNTTVVWIIIVVVIVVMAVFTIKLTREVK